MRTILPSLLCVWFVLLAHGAAAQSAVAGVVKDATGAVLPGVTVEASSPALIEKAKTATTERGRPVSHRRSSARNLLRHLHVERFQPRSSGEGIVLEANFTAPINVEMRLGSLAESVTVTGESPVVDVQTSQVPPGRFPGAARGDSHRPQLPADAPTSRRPSRRGTLRRRGLELGVDRRQPARARIGRRRLADADRRHGRRRDVRQWPVLVRLRQREPDAGNGRAGVGRDGGAPVVRRAGQPHSEVRRQHASTATACCCSRTAACRATTWTMRCGRAGMTTPARLAEQYDINFSASGPILRDRLWFFASGRHWAYNNYVADVFNPDGISGGERQRLRAFPSRLTWQMSTARTG